MSKLCCVDRYSRSDYVEVRPLAGSAQEAAVHECPTVLDNHTVYNHRLLRTYLQQPAQKNTPAELSRLLQDQLHVHPHPPLPTESREQYWRRLAAHYIEHYTVSHAPSPSPTAYHHHELHEGEPFFLIDLGRVVEQVARWRTNLPTVRPYYAVKCNPFPPLIRLLAALDCGFDCASAGEMKMIASILQWKPEEMQRHVLLANPAKQPLDLAVAAQLGVQRMTFDNIDELEKIAAAASKNRTVIQAVLRLSTNDSAAVCAFSLKFGADMDDVPRLVERAAELREHVTLAGVSFHVGSGNSDPQAYIAALMSAKHTVELAKQFGLNECHLLDLGGGFSGDLESDAGEAEGFQVVAATINEVLATHFKDMTVISEPGRFMTEASHALVMNVYARRVVVPPTSVPSPTTTTTTTSFCVDSDDTKEWQYYLNDGLYGSFNCMLYDHAHPTLLLLNDSEPQRRPLHTTTIFGPTCDALDCLLLRQPFPQMEIGDWVLAPGMGSYTTAAGSPFNGIAVTRYIMVSSISS